MRRIFPSTKIEGIGCLQDGGMSGHNNPLHLARSECLRLASGLSEVDVAISIGTGSTKRRVSPSTGSFRHFLLDGGFQRVWRAYMTNSFDGDKTFEEVRKLLPKERRENYIRLNVSLPARSIGLDDVTKLGELERCVDESPDLKRRADDAIYALTVASFYFRLEGMPQLKDKGYMVRGMIRSRLPGDVIVKLLHKIPPGGQMGFHETGRSAINNLPLLLGLYSGEGDLCVACRRYCKRVSFHVADLDREICIQFSAPSRATRRIGAFPQKIQWFIDQQHLAHPFGHGSHHTMPGNDCRQCSQQERTEAQASRSPSNDVVTITPSRSLKRVSRSCDSRATKKARGS